MEKSQYDRIFRYRNQGKENDTETVEKWIKDEKNPKCLLCIEMGIRYCRFWLTNYNCEKYGGDKTTELLRNIFGKKKHK